MLTLEALKMQLRSQSVDPAGKRWRSLWNR
jgi:hypothetical protein